MARPIGTREIPALSDRDPRKQQFFEEVKFRLDNGVTPAPSPAPAPTPITQLTGTGTAGSDLLAYRAVTTDTLGQIIYADAGTPAHGQRVLGVTLNAAGGGASVTYVSGGDIDNPGWSWSAGQPIFLGLGGTLIQSPNVGVFQIQLGYAKTATKMFVELGLPIFH